ncbi:tautomerase family protein [Buttiauxella agrestis]
MPGITLTLSGCKDQKLTKECVLLATQITCEILKKNSFETMVIVRHVDDDDWFIDGKSLAEWGKIRLDLKLLSWMKRVAKIRKQRIKKQFTTLWTKLLVTYILSQMCMLLIVKLLHMDTQG